MADIEADAEIFCTMAFRGLEEINRAALRRFVYVIAARASLIAMAACAPYTAERIAEHQHHDGDRFARRVVPRKSHAPVPIKLTRMSG